jgi:two-component system response regulator PilR (NtrC family)
LSEAAVAELLQYDFPGNVRELENTLERAVALSNSDELQPVDLALHRVGSEADMMAESAASAPDLVLDRPLPAYLDGVERKAILDALAKTGFNRTAAAKLLGITFRALRYRMQRLGIREPAAGGPGA